MSWEYKNNANNTARFTLGEYDNVTYKTLICVGINPSTATPNNLDPTLKKVKAVALSHNYKNWIMINVYPQRATNPNNLHLNSNTQLHNDNIREIRYILNTFNNADILFAYGNLISKRAYLNDCLADVLGLISSVQFTGNLYCIKHTVKGNPIHPLYQKVTTAFIPY